MAIDKVTDALASGKIKDRNDGLAELEALSSSKLRLAPKPFKQLIRAIFELLTHESGIYRNNASAMVEERMVRASSCLRIITTKATERTGLKYRSYLELVSLVIAHFDDLPPCHIDLVSTVGSILQQGAFKDHLTRSDWRRIFVFLKKPIRMAIDAFDDTTGSEKLLAQLFRALHDLLQCNRDTSTCYLQVFDHYFDLLELIQHTVRLCRKESVLIVLLLKIINKLITVLSTEDVRFVQRLVHIGLSLCVGFHRTSWDSLLAEILIFLNLPSTHTLVTTDHVPSLIEDADTSIRSPPPESDDVVVAYRVKMLIHDLVGKLNTGVFRFEGGISMRREIQNNQNNRNNKNNQIHDSNFPHDPRNDFLKNVKPRSLWFQLLTIYLSSINAKPWMLANGLSKLVVTYFVLKLRLTHMSDANSRMAYEIGAVAGTLLGKRPKLDVVSEALRQSHTAPEFCHRLLMHRDDDKMQRIGLQILLFYVDNGGELPEPAHDTAHDTSFEIPLDFHASSRNSLFKAVLGTFDNNALHYWLLLAANALVNHDLQPGHKLHIDQKLPVPELQPRYLLLALKIALQLVKHEQLCSIACILVQNVITGNARLTLHMDKSIVTQVDNVVDLSEIHGPYVVCNESFDFWYAISKIVRDKNLSKRAIIGDRIQDWLLAKWQVSFIGKRNVIQLASTLPQFLCWLCGIPVSYPVTVCMPDMYEEGLGEVDLFQRSYADLEEFMFLRETDSSLEKQSLKSHDFKSNDLKSHASFSDFPLSRNPREPLFIRVLDTMQTASMAADHIACLEWALVMQQLVHEISDTPALSHAVASMSYQLSTVFDTMAHMGLVSEQCIRLLNAIPLELWPDQGFPYDKIVLSLPQLLQPKRTHDMIDDEFGETKTGKLIGEFDKTGEFDISNRDFEQSTRYITSYYLLKLAPPVTVHAMSFLLSSHTKRRSTIKVMLVSALTFLESSGPIDTLYAVSCLVEHLGRQDMTQVGAYTVSRLVRLVGERLLTRYEVERNELTLMVISRLMTICLPVSLEDDGLKKDCYDMCHWLAKCGEQELILTQLSAREFSKFVVEFMVTNDETVLGNTQLRSIGLRYFEMVPNVVKANLLKTYSQFVSTLDSTAQADWYNCLFEAFRDPEQSVETSATYTYFFSVLSQSSVQIMLSALFNLLELSRFPFFVPYLQNAMSMFCAIVRVDTPRELFRTLSVEILRRWMRFSEISLFPYTLFGYADLTKFVSANYRELTAIGLALREVKFDQSLLEMIADVRASSVPAVVGEALPLVIPLAYSRDGVRNMVFEVLSQYLGDQLRAQMKAKLCLLVYETIKYTDMSREQPLLEFFPQSHLANKLLVDSKTVDHPGETVVSLSSSLELTKKLLQKYSPHGFWSTRLTFFLVRRLSLLFLRAITADLRVLLLRKLKYVLVVSGVLDVHVRRLLIDTLCQLLQEEKLHADVFAFVSAMEMNKDSLLHITRLLAACIKVDCTSYLPQLMGVMEYVEGIGEEGGEELKQKERLKEIIEQRLGTHFHPGHFGLVLIGPILRAAMGVISKKPSRVSSDVILRFLGDSSVGEDLKVATIDLVLSMFSCVDDVAEAANGIAIRLLREFAPMTQCKAFQQWVCRCLAEFYLSGQNNWVNTNSSLQLTNGLENPSNLADATELRLFNPESRDLLSGRMNETWRKIISYMTKGTAEDAACAESIVGAVIFEHGANPTEIDKLLDFDVVSSLEHILPLDFHTCILLNDSEVDFLGDTTESVISNLHDVISEPVERWTKRLLLALLLEISAETSLAPLVASFAIKVPTFALEILPSFVCFYVYLRGPKTIIALMQAFASVDQPSVASIELFLRVLLLMRVGQRNKVDSFAAVVASIDTKAYYLMAARTQLSKSAMMLFEDWKYAEGDPIISQYDAKSLSAVYLEIGEADLLAGLPTETTVEVALKSLDQLQYTSALLDTRMSNEDAEISETVSHRPPESLASQSSLAPLSSLASSLIAASALSHGMNGIASMISQTHEESYEWAWKLNRWELPVESEPKTEHAVIYKTLKQINDTPARALSVCENISLELLANRSHESYWLRALAAVESVRELLTTNDLIEAADSFDTKTAWFAHCDMSIGESIVLARQVALQVMSGFPVKNRTWNRDSLWFVAVNERAKVGQWALQSKEETKMVLAMVFIEDVARRLRGLNSLGLNSLSDFSRYFAARTLWALGQTSMPVALLKSISKVDSPLTLRVDDALIKATLVEWISQSRQELAETVMAQYVEPTVRDLEERGGSPENIAESGVLIDAGYSTCSSTARVFSMLAHFCDKQAKAPSLVSQISKLEKRVTDKRTEIDELKAHYGRTSVPSQEKKAVQRFYSRLKSQLQLESLDLAEMRANRERFANTAVELYLKSVSASDDEEVLDSFFALWLERADTASTDLLKAISALPSHKFVSWSTQLIARLSLDTSSPFQQVLHQIIIQMCVDHPHHTLYQLLSLKMHEEFAKTNPVLAAKVLAAKNLCEKLAQTLQNYLENVFRPIEEFCEQSVKLATTKPSRGRSITLDRRLYWVSNLPNITPPTLYIEIDRTRRYNNAPRFSSIDPKISIASSGLSLPKIAKFTLSDGMQHKVLFKSGTDDLRQDSIMEQVFDKVNHIFSRDKETRRRALNIRTYRAIPLGPTAGVIEFVPNSLALIDIVKPYHQQHDQISLDKAREKMKAVQSEDKAERVRIFQEVTTKIVPVLHMFFADTFVTPDTWYASRVRYSHGIATNSMVGHILGLGDRHCNNILIDRLSGEPVHIDLGVAFDQGKRLPIPETVPFRLTRDIVDGFGCSGVEGIFRKSCEHTFRVLRENKEHVLSILDVLRWDPLYTWSLSPIKKKKLQEEVAAGVAANLQPQEEGSEAGRAVLMVSEKLVAGGLSTEAAVRELINGAVNVNNLALIYFGWSPFY